MQFALMWANQDWVDVHPAKRGWHSTGRPSPEAAIIGRNCTGPAQLQMFDEFVRASPGRPSTLSVSHSTSVFHGFFVWVRRTLNG